jgi:hypothetical protein
MLVEIDVLASQAKQFSDATAGLERGDDERVQMGPGMLEEPRLLISGEPPRADPLDVAVQSD